MGHKRHDRILQGPPRSPRSLRHPATPEWITESLSGAAGSSAPHWPPNWRPEIFSVDTNGRRLGCATGIVWLADQPTDTEAPSQDKIQASQHRIQASWTIHGNVTERSEAWGALLALRRLPPGTRAQVYADTLEACRVLRGEGEHRYEQEAARLLAERDLKLEVHWVKRSHPRVQAADRAARRRWQDQPGFEREHDPLHPVPAPTRPERQGQQAWMNLRAGLVDLRLRRDGSEGREQWMGWTRAVTRHGAAAPALAIADAVLAAQPGELTLFTRLGAPLWSGQRILERAVQAGAVLHDEIEHIRQAQRRVACGEVRLHLRRQRGAIPRIPQHGARIDLLQRGAQLRLKVELDPNLGLNEHNLSETSHQAQTAGLGLLLAREIERVHAVLPPHGLIAVHAGGGTLELLDLAGGRSWSGEPAMTPAATERVRIHLPGSAGQASDRRRKLRDQAAESRAQRWLVPLTLAFERRAEVLGHLSGPARARALHSAPLAGPTLHVLAGRSSPRDAARSVLSHRNFSDHTERLIEEMIGEFGHDLAEHR